MASCAQAGADLALVEGMKVAVDCNIAALVNTGYATLAGPQSQMPAILGALLAIYIAVFGLRLMLGLAPLNIGDTTLTVVKLGAVVALATSWPLYQGLVFDTLFKGPEQIAGALLGGSGGADKALASTLGSLQMAFDELQASSEFYAQRSSSQASPFLGGAGFSAFALNASSILMLLTTLGLMLAAKVVLALLLVLGPVFIAFLLFDATRGLFEGWLRAAIAFALAPVLGVVTLVIVLNLLQPHLARLAVIRAQAQIDNTPAIAVLCLVLVATAIALGGGVAMGIMATGFKLNWRKARRPDAAKDAGAVGSSPGLRETVAASAAAGAAELPARTQQVAAAAAAMERRDLRLFVNPEPAFRSQSAPRDAGRADPVSPLALGQTGRRTAQSRSMSSARRDG